MYLKTFQLKNFRRLKDVRVDLEEKETIFVGANNSGKTSATYAFRLFLGSGKKFKLYDFSSDCWEQFNRLATNESLNAPEISLDLWFSVDDLNLHRVIGILPSLEWQGKPVGVRLCFKPKDVKRLIENFKAAREESRKKDKEREELTICDYLERALTEEYEVVYYVLDAEKFDSVTNAQLPDYEPHLIESANEGAKLINSLLRVDFLDAQRHLSDTGDSGRYENLSKRLGRYYKKNTEKPEVDPGAISAIRSSEEKINNHLTEAFEPLLTSLKELGYPGVSNPNPIIKSILNIEEILNSGTEVHYALPADADGTENARTLPDQYNGLGFKNLIFMVIELLDFHSQWINTSEARPPIHLVMIEEPEAHLHIQLQQVFIRKLFELVGDAGEGFTSQFAVTTHSPHILYESNFKPIRYFSRKSMGASSLVTIVKDLSKFYESEKESRDFLQRYLKLTHCDLFFSDGTILVEGNVERLIVPLIIEKDKHELTSCHLTLLEVGGAYAHKFEKLVEFLEIPTLIITDIDSVAPGATENEEDEDEDGDDITYKPGESCPTSYEGAVTSNEALKHWFPEKETIASLLLVDDADKIIAEKGKEGFIRIAYQTQNSIKWQSDTNELVGRTLEEAFALENLVWIQDATQKSLGIKIKDADKIGLSDLHLKIFKRVKSKGFDKTKFALGLIASDPDDWVSPQYIVDGLGWLYSKIEPEVLTVKKSDKAKAENV